MKHAQNPRRGRGRGGPGKRHPHSKNRNYESGGGEGKVRGNAKQILDKYQAMAREAAAAGEHILAEGYWQHAEHYYRVLNVDRDDRPADRGNDRNRVTSNVDLDQPEASETKPAQVREIPIEKSAQPVAETPAPAAPDHRQAEPVQAVPQFQPEAEKPEAEELKAEKPEEVKPKRRGRPRKVVVDAPETPEPGTSTEPVSA